MALVIAVAMVLAMGVVAFAADPATTGTITIQNAARGETYKAFKLFDAHLGNGGAITYTGEIPASLADFFTKDSTGNIQKATGKSDADIAAAVQAWAATATGEVASGTGTGDPLVFTVPFGYYAVTSTQGTVVSVNSTNPNVVIYDKNSTTVTAEKTVEKTSYSIGDTINYTATFNTANYLTSEGATDGSAAKQVVDYVISDTLPEFLSNVAVDSIKIMSKDGTTEIANVTAQFDSNKKITIVWADEVTPATTPRTWTSRYANGVKIVVKYHGTLTSVTNVNTVDTNTISILPDVVDDNGNPTPWNKPWEDTAEVKTYAAALKKVDENGNALPGAKFTIKGLTVTGEAGEYTVVSYDPSSTTESAQLDTDANGMLYIVGLASDVQLAVTEVKAPDGYNKLNDAITLTPQLLATKIYKESGTIYYDADGNVVSTEAASTTSETVNKNLTDLDPGAVQVKNQKGSELPTTGGIGTTIFYIVGAILVVGGGILLVSRRRMSSN